jgi:nitrogen regulatory protein P-II 2
MQLHKLTLVTIIAETILREPIVHKVIELGASGVSYHSTGGTGSRHSRHDVILGENVQIKVICSRDLAEKILTYVSHHYFENYACIAWMNDVEVVRGENYVTKPAGSK